MDARYKTKVSSLLQARPLRVSVIEWDLVGFGGIW
jgi:hypothetical protein